jgi:hypothetical protein
MSAYLPAILFGSAKITQKLKFYISFFSVSFFIVSSSTFNLFVQGAGIIFLEEPTEA